jgi:hypothetical protein
MLRVNIPPIVTYIFGAFLIVFGILRVKYLGAPRPPETEEGAPDDNAPPVRGVVQKRHVRWGVIYVLLGLFLIISTYIQIHRRM